MIKALILDFGGVMVTMPHDAPSVLEVAAELGIPHDRLIAELIDNEDWELALVGAIDEDEFNRRLHTRFDLPHEVDQASLLSRTFRDEKLSTELLALADRLREHLKVAILSNAGSDFEERLLRDKFDILDRFDLVINSSRVGVKKPDPAIYELTLDRLGVQPHEALFVDDQQPNVDAAAALGIHAIRFQNEQQAIEEINALLSRR